MAHDYRMLADKCRFLARRMTDKRTIDVLMSLAEEYDAKAAQGIEPNDVNRHEAPVAPKPE